ncbi:hypothetical protein [Gilvibacter sediminis]|uniref:hypothetical protein n=1 Tax=Gilvibacter sediminis TaxID=379071 RepID=UPI00234FB9A3|nr:hypothetical protein [Gilvibacter sediminis]MDC7998432.1 hypothetical protein [Gilvibacter sediminis]
MKRLRTYIYLIVLLPVLGYTQVGIGTRTPSADLHVADPAGTVRIESLNATNNPTYNDGVNLAPVFVDGNGDIVLGNGTGASGQEPLNFLIEVPNFIDDNVDANGFGRGAVVNSDDSGESAVQDRIAQVVFTTPVRGIIELKYAVSAWVAGSDLNLGCSPCAYPDNSESVVFQTYFVVDLNSDGLDALESSRVYGYNGQYFLSNNAGGQGYAYINGIANFKAPAGTHTLYLYGIVQDSASSYTSVGFGGAEDFLKIRVFN